MESLSIKCVALNLKAKYYHWSQTKADLVYNELIWVFALCQFHHLRKSPTNIFPSLTLALDCGSLKSFHYCLSDPQQPILANSKHKVYLAAWSKKDMDKEHQKNADRACRKVVCEDLELVYRVDDAEPDATTPAPILGSHIPELIWGKSRVRNQASMLCRSLTSFGY